MRPEHPVWCGWCLKEYDIRNQARHLATHEARFLSPVGGTPKKRAYPPWEVSWRMLE